jgi:hypothetical protein
MNRTIKQSATALLLESGLSPSFWPQAVMTAVYNRNRSPSSSIDYRIPFEMLNSHKTDYSSMQIFGIKVFVKRTDSMSKYDPPGTIGVFVGYPADKRGYVVYLSNLNSQINLRLFLHIFLIQKSNQQLKILHLLIWKFYRQLRTAFLPLLRQLFVRTQSITKPSSPTLGQHTPTHPIQFFQSKQHLTKPLAV